MAISKNNIIKIINDYKAFRGKKALPTNLDIKEVDRDVDYLDMLVRQAPGDEIPITNPEDAQHISKAINILSAISGMESVEEIHKKIERGKEIIDELMKQAPQGGGLSDGVIQKITGNDVRMESQSPDYLRTSSAFTSPTEEVPFSMSVRTLGQLKHMLNDWKNKKDRVYFPPDTLAEKDYYNNPEVQRALYEYRKKKTDIQYYQQFSNQLPIDMQVRLSSMLNQLSDINNKFAVDKERYTSAIEEVVSRLGGKVANRGPLADNTIISLGELSINERKAFQELEILIKIPEQHDIFTPAKTFLQEYNTIHQAFARESQSTIDKRIRDQRAARDRDLLESARKKASQNVPYDALTKEEQAALEREGNKASLIGRNMYQQITDDEQSKLAVVQPEQGQPNAPLGSQAHGATTHAEETATEAEANVKKFSAAPKEAGAEAGKPAGNTFEEKQAEADRLLQEKTNKAFPPDYYSKVETEQQKGQTILEQKTTEAFKPAPQESEHVIYTSEGPVPFDKYTGRGLTNVNGVLPGAEAVEASAATTTAASTAASAAANATSAVVLSAVVKPRSFFEEFDAAHVAITATRRSEFRKFLLNGKFEHITDMPSLLGPSYDKLMWNWLRQQGRYIKGGIRKGLQYIGNGIVDVAGQAVVGVGNFMVRNLKRVTFYNIWGDRFKHAVGEFKTAFKTWAGKTKAVKFIRRVQLLKIPGKRKKSLVSGLIEGAIKFVVEGIVEGAQIVAKTAVAVVNVVKGAAGLPKSLVNSPTSIYKQLSDFAGEENVTADANQLIRDIGNGWQKFTTTAGDALSIISGVTKPIGYLLDSIPAASITMLSTWYVTGSLPIALGIGATAGVTRMVTKLVSEPIPSGLASEEGFAKIASESEWGPLGSGVHGLASWINGGYVGLSKLGPGFLIGELNTAGADVSKLSPTAMKLALANGGVDVKNLTPEEMVAKLAAGEGRLSSPLGSALRSLNTGVLLGSIGMSVGMLLGGPTGAIILGAGGFAAGAAGQQIYDNFIGKNVLKGGFISKLLNLPIWATVQNSFAIGALGQELSLVQTKYHWDFGRYFKNEFQNPWIALGRSMNWISGGWSVINIPRITLGWLTSNMFRPALLKLATFLGGSTQEASLAAATRAAGFWSILGWAAGVGILAMLGVPLTPIVLFSTALGATVGTVVAVIAVPTLSWEGPPGWLAGFAIVTAATAFAGWLGSLIDKWSGNLLNKALSYGMMFMNGIMSLFELFMLFKNGLDFSNIIRLVIALVSISTTYNYLQNMTGTNVCTQESECPAQSGTADLGSSTYLAYFDVTVVSKDSSSAPNDVQKIVGLLNQNPDYLYDTFGSRKKYIYVGTTDATYVSDTTAVIQISSSDLYTNKSLTAMIPANVASANN